MDEQLRPAAMPRRPYRWAREARRCRVGSARVRVALPLTAVLAVAAGCGNNAGGPAQWQAAESRPSVSAAPSATAERKTVSFSATGDIIMGSAPGKLPANGGEGFFDDVREPLAADLAMGNLEQPLTDDTGYAKCGAPKPTPSASAGATPSPTKPSGCHQFRLPPGYAAHLRDAGFMVLNQANNHANDYGPTGYRNTRKALEKHGLKHTGSRDEITMVEVKGLKVAVIGFSPYASANSLTSISAAKKIVARAAEQADLVVVQAHMGAEGSTKTRVKPGTEMFLGENRGDPIKFSHAVIDAGADLVVGHGPHVLRGLEFYEGRLIAYSLGNFAGGGGTLSRTGPLGLGAVLRVSLNPDGTFGSGEFVSTSMNAAGEPTVDSRKRSLELATSLGEKDFGSSHAKLDGDGAISAP